MALIVGVLKETFPAERRVAAVPRTIDLLKKAGVEVWIEREAGLEAGFFDEDYMARGAQAGSADDVRSHARIFLQVRVPELPDGFKRGDAVVGFCDPLT
ncbi:MAG: NAD(P)(+) transhydrogenase (Re/Si-specific) subunit alpha, partial [Bryobacteraceae bacterium]